VSDSCLFGGGSSDTKFAGPTTAILTIIRRIELVYSAPAYDVTTQCCRWQTHTAGMYRLLSGSMQVSPAPDEMCCFTDRFGNQTVEIKHQQIESRLAVNISFEVEGRQHLKREERDASLDSPQPFLGPTPLTTADAGLDEALSELLSSRASPAMKSTTLANDICSLVHHKMRYRSGATQITTPASKAWAQRGGVCQDYSHVMLALCRRVGIPARYVSGYVLGESGPIAMHAWVEVYVGASDGNSSIHRSRDWLALDPTKGRIAGSNYLAMAIGRDYSDVKPISGQFRGCCKAVLRTATRMSFVSSRSRGLRLPHHCERKSMDGNVAIGQLLDLNG
jgi:transglutaminase-like putative cysteine protease